MAPGIILDHPIVDSVVTTRTKSEKVTPTQTPSQTPQTFPEEADTEAYARFLDSADPLRHLRDHFLIPTKRSLQATSLTSPTSSQKGHPHPQEDEEQGIYFCGNSLGLQPQRVRAYIDAHLQAWSSIGVGGHFRHLENSPLKPWQEMADFVAEQSCPLVGALPGEVAVANTLTVNLHLLMAAFYRPTATRRKVLLEWKAFPSDHYAIESQMSWHGFDPKEAMILVEPDNDHIISTERILATIDQHADELALILLPGIQYYSGQLLDIARITKHAHSKDLLIGWDLAHAAGNVPLNLHDWDVDFAAWCTYKYMNAGPGSIAGLFVNEKHGKVEYPDGATEPVFRHRLTGWYSGDRASRFQMDNKFRPTPGAGGFQISNPSAIDLTCLAASLSVFCETSIQDLRQKSLKLTGYLQHLLLKDTACNDTDRLFRIITPLDPSQRGAQLCLLLKPGLLEQVAADLHSAGIVVDQRKPGVVRVAPVPFYNTFHDVWAFVQVFRRAIAA